jgi:hypothetical protein
MTYYARHGALTRVVTVSGVGWDGGCGINATLDGLRFHPVEVDEKSAELFDLEQVRHLVSGETPTQLLPKEEELGQLRETLGLVPTDEPEIGLVEWAHQVAALSEAEQVHLLWRWASEGRKGVRWCSDIELHLWKTHGTSEFISACIQVLVARGATETGVHAFFQQHVVKASAQADEAIAAMARYGHVEILHWLGNAFTQEGLDTAVLEAARYDQPESLANLLAFSPSVGAVSKALEETLARKRDIACAIALLAYLPNDGRLDDLAQWLKSLERFSHC